jgi:hypothetical protein
MRAFFAWRLLRGLQAKNQAFRSNSSDLLMQILWDFRYNPLRPTGFPGFGTGSSK